MFTLFTNNWLLNCTVFLNKNSAQSLHKSCVMLLCAYQIPFLKMKVSYSLSCSISYYYYYYYLLLLSLLLLLKGCFGTKVPISVPRYQTARNHVMGGYLSE